MNRPTTITYKDLTPTVTLGYDAVANSTGQLTSISNGNSATTFTAFDALGRVTASSQQTNGLTYGFTYTYNLAGTLSSKTYPSARVVTTGCMLQATAKGAAIGTGAGMVTGGIAGIETGPGAIAAAQVGGMVGGPAGAALGYSIGLVTCMSGTGTGGGGTQVMSKTLWKDDKRGVSMLKIQTPDRGRGQLHYQDQTGKYLYNPQTGQFDGAPNRVNQLLSDPRVQAAIQKGLGYLGQ